MEKKNAKTREITFKSSKNSELRMVHNRTARNYAECLERDNKVESYRTNVPLVSLAEYANMLGIRPAYQSEQWTTDFVVSGADGSVMVAEISDEESLKRKAIVEKLEISRRYWHSKGVNAWKIIIGKKEDGAW